MRQLHAISIYTLLLVLSVSSAARSETIDFDGLAAGTIVNSLQGVTFTAPFDLIVSTGFDTTSGSNYLGVDDGFSEEFFGDEGVNLAFDVPVTSLTVDFIARDDRPEGVPKIFTIASGDDPDDFTEITAFFRILDDGGEVYQGTLSAAAPFSSAILLSSAPDSIYTFNIDTLTYAPVPIPGTWILMGSGLALLIIKRKKNKV